MVDADRITLYEEGCFNLRRPAGRELLTLTNFHSFPIVPVPPFAPGPSALLQTAFWLRLFRQDGPSSSCRILFRHWPFLNELLSAEHMVCLLKRRC